MKLYEYYNENEFNPTMIDLSSKEKLRTHWEKRSNFYIVFFHEYEMVHTGFHKIARYYFVLAFCPKLKD